MTATIIDQIPFTPDLEHIIRVFKVKPESATGKELKRLLDQARSIAKPKAMYKVVTVEVGEKDKVYLDGVPFRSQVLCVNLEGVRRAFPYIATCGLELHHWRLSFLDPFTSYLADTITAFGLESALETFTTYLADQYDLGKTAIMNPGSLEDWPLQAQIPLFKLLGNPQTAIGVSLTEAMLMIPRQSVSGVIFETDKDFVNCQLCPRDNCPNRRAKYDGGLRTHYQPHQQNH